MVEGERGESVAKERKERQREERVLVFAAATTMGLSRIARNRANYTECGTNVGGARG